MTRYCGNVLYGQYGSDGYEIYDGRGRQVYAAGNSPLDSQQHVDPAVGVPPGLLADYCEATGIELAAERGAQWLGAGPAEEGDE